MKTKLLLFIVALFTLGISKVIAQTHTFTYTGAPQTYTVPAGIHYLAVDAMGASGGVDDSYSFSIGGCGGRIKSVIEVTPGALLYIYVGGKGLNTSIRLRDGGYNGGGFSGLPSPFGVAGSGGGGTDLRIGGTAIINRVLVAGGGGGGGIWGTVKYEGGAGGGLEGLPAVYDKVVDASSGLGATQISGGAGAILWSRHGDTGSLFYGGQGGHSGGGGGGGYYGGGGGIYCGGGGGGSSYISSTIGLSPVYISGENCNSDGILTITDYSCLPPFAGNIIGDTVSCIGGSTTLTDTGGAMGGVWSSGNPAVVNIDATSGSTTGMAVGTTTITYSVTNSCGTAIATTTVKVTGASCSGAGTPVAGIISGARGCGRAVVRLVTNGASRGCGIKYQWQKSLDTTTWEDILTPNDTIVKLNITSFHRTYFRCKVYCVYSGAVSYTGILNLFDYNIDSHTEIKSDSDCNRVLFRITSCGEIVLRMRTYFGDGSYSDTTLPTGSTSAVGVTVHNYSSSGSYTVKHILYDSIGVQDSVIFTYNHVSCKTLPIKFYFDNNSNCVFDSGDYFNRSVFSVAVDSSGVPTDTFSCTSGFYYHAFEAPVGTIYTFTPLSGSGGLLISCPGTGAITDTIRSGVYVQPVKYFGLSCSSIPGFDLSVTNTIRYTMRQAGAFIYVYNSFCTPQDAIITCNINPKYRFAWSEPTPTSIAGNTVSWLIPSLAYRAIPPAITLRMRAVDLTIMPGDTVLTSYTVNPISGDADSINNKIIQIDTVRAAYDPNYKEVSPFGNILAGDDLTYTVHFENMGNDTAHNVHVLDTLSDMLDVKTIRVLSATEVMNYSFEKVGPYNIARFDFPNIKLLDSSHHGYSTAMFTFKIQSKPTIADGTVIPNRVGIYFDDNPVVMTEYSYKKVGVGPITGPDTVCKSANITLVQTEGPFYGTWSKRHDKVAVTAGVTTGLITGDDTVDYTCTNRYMTRSVYKKVTVMPLPDVITITGADTLCEGDSAMLTGSLSGGYWQSAGSNLWVDSLGNIAALQPGTGNIAYSIPNYCGLAVAYKTVFVIADTICRPTPVLRLPPGLYLNPNPNKGIFDLLFTSDKDEQVTIALYNVVGKRLATYQITTNKTEQFNLSIAKGVYILYAESPRNKFVRKVVVE